METEWARELYALARDRICRAHPYLALALNRLEPAVDAALPAAATDGARFYFNPDWARRASLEDPRRVDETLFHALSHCLLGHVFLPEPEGAPPWACLLYTSRCV